MAMDMRNWCSSGTGTIRLGRGCGELEQAYSSAGWRRPKWKLLWRKFLNEKRKKFDSSVHVQHVPYDVSTYLLNFDHGLIWDDEPDGLSSRSFSVRFADPSLISLSRN